MRTRARSELGVAADASEAVYERTSRRGLLARVSTMLLGIGVGSAVGTSTAEADAASCCTGRYSCNSTGAGCPGIGQCSTGWTYTGYTWNCCSGGKRVYCTDCRRNGSTTVCVCTYKTREPCKAAMTATELSAGVAG